MKLRTIKNVNEVGYELTGSIQPNLTECTDYFILGIDNLHFRAVSDSLEPYLYRKELFIVSDLNIPDSWIRSNDDDGSYSIDPIELSEKYFYEDYFDGVQEVVDKYNKFLNDINIMK